MGTISTSQSVDEISVLGVLYQHVRLGDGSDLYLTRYGQPFRNQLLPENVVSDEAWFTTNSRKLFGTHMRSGGTGNVYRVRTKPVDGESIDIVLKWNRMAQDIPGYRDFEELWSAEFNSPFEEFGLVMEMREANHDSGRQRIYTHKPLAIYVPVKPVQAWQLGRSNYKMRQKMRVHTEIDLDENRSYAVIYEWVNGVDLAEACHQELLTKAFIRDFTLAVDKKLLDAGYLVRDKKPQHIIVRPEGRFFRARRDGELPPHALVDFELLERTPVRVHKMRALRRHDYLVRQVNRFDDATSTRVLPPGLELVTLLGVTYVHGRAHSTGGNLWVVGKDPMLFDYFLPERWKPAPRTRLSASDEVYETTSKDGIHLVWKVSRTGRIPGLDPFRPQERARIQHGYNSPFEEVAIAMELNNAGVPATFPRAIYMTNHQCEIAPHLRDSTRYESHRNLLLQDGTSFLRDDRDYITVWGYWNRSDADLASNDGDYYQPINTLRALREGMISEEIYYKTLQKTQEALAAIGFEDLEFGGRHKLLALDHERKIVLDPDRLPAVRICNFEFMRHT